MTKWGCAKIWKHGLHRKYGLKKEQVCACGAKLSKSSVEFCEKHLKARARLNEEARDKFVPTGPYYFNKREMI